MLRAVQQLFSGRKAAAAPAPDSIALGNESLARGNLAGAEQHYRRAVDERATDAVPRVNLGYVLLERGQPGEAQRVLEAATKLDPWHHEAHFLLGRARRDSGSLAAALESFDAALALAPNFGFARRERDALLQQFAQEALDSDRPQDARRWFSRWAAASPHHADAHAGLALAAELGQDWDVARASYQRALDLNPGHPQAWFGLGNVRMEKGEPETAANAYGRAVTLLPNHAPSLSQWARALVAAARYDEAEARFQRLLQLTPDDPQALLGLANCLLALGRNEEALALYDRLVSLSPSVGQVHLNRGNALLELGRTQEALGEFTAAAEVQPDYLEAHVNAGNVLQALNRYDEAIASYLLALQLRPDHAAAHWNLALALLVTGELESGWAEAEWRWQALGRSPRSTEAPRWTGSEPLPGRSILVTSEQGFGDTLQFCRYATLLAQSGARVILRAQPALVRLLASLQPPCEVIRDGDPAPAHDYQIPLLSLPHAFGTTLASVPAPRQYLWADPDQVNVWRERLPAGAGDPLVGIAWSGNATQVNDRNRSLAFERLHAVLGSHRCVSLQKEVRPTDREALQRSGVLDFGGQLTDFADTAALIACVDLVIAVDTSVAHLAAALGKPVWLLLSFSPDWRYLLSRPDCPWYPTMRLYRQPRFGDWGSVLAALRADLEQAFPGVREGSAAS